MDEHETRRGREISYNTKGYRWKNVCMNKQTQRLSSINTYISGVKSL